MPLSDHLRKIVPGAVCAAIGGIMLLFGGLFYMVGYITQQQMAETYAEFAQFGIEYSRPESGIMPFSVGLIFFGFIFLFIGIGYIAKGVSIYRNSTMRRRRQEDEEERSEVDESEDTKGGLEVEEEDVEEAVPPKSPPSVRARSASQCPRCGEILLDSMDTCPSCKRTVETRLAAPAILPAARKSVVFDKVFCMYCGNRMPDTPDLSFCPICGKKIA